MSDAASDNTAKRAPYGAFMAEEFAKPRPAGTAQGRVGRRGVFH